MGLFNALVSGMPWRRTSRETDYESVLSRLDQEIDEVQTRLAQIRRRQRRASVTLTLQAVLLWSVYTGACWLFGLLTWPHDGVGASVLAVWMPVLGSPAFIFSVRRIVKWWYRRIGAAEDKHLIDLKRQKRDKIDELKRATKYDHLRMLLDKYDDNTRANITTTPVKKGSPQGSAGSAKGSPATPQAQPAQTAQPIPHTVRPHTAAPRPSPVPVMPRTWMDKVADAVLGADPGAVGPEQKYALICSKCHAHNGLALRQEFSEMQYVCPHCGQFNSRRPSSAPIGSPFRAEQPRTAPQAPQTPTKTANGPNSKLRPDPSDSEDDDDDDDKPPATSLQETSLPRSPQLLSERDTRLKSLRARKPHDMDLDD